MIKPNILVAGIGGASLGTEVLKCLARANRYTIFGCDVSPLAFGHYQQLCKQTLLADRTHYVESIVDICGQAQIQCIVPGGEEPLALLNGGREELKRAGIQLAANSETVTSQFSDKQTTFEVLTRLGFEVPKTAVAEREADLDSMSFPCVVKPAVGSGGSSFLFLAEDRQEALLYVNYLARNGKRAIVQEYIGEEEGEFTIGVLSLPDGTVAGSVALKRILHSKLSVLLRSPVGVISTGYSQGLIDDFPALRATAERIATAVGSVGPINVQGRVRAGELIPFEINPRFSASTYLRALAGFNEIDIYLQYLLKQRPSSLPPLKHGYYLRTLNEIFIPRDGLIK